MSLDTTGATSPTRRHHPGTTSTVALLRCGAAAGPFFVIAGFAQMPFRPGFDPTRHAFSFLLIGPGGWVQTCVFVITALGFGAASLGLARALPDRLGRLGRVASVLAAALAGGLLLGGLAAPQPSFGFPIGAPAGAPDVMTTGSILHAVGFGLSMLSWTALLVVLGTVLRRLGHRGATSYLTALALPVVPLTSTQPFGTVLLYVVVTIAFGVTSLALVRIARTVGGVGNLAR